MIYLLVVQVPFTLAWGCDGIKNRHHKHDVVSFERGDITTALRSSKQVKICCTLDITLDTSAGLLRPAYQLGVPFK